MGAVARNSVDYIFGNGDKPAVQLNIADQLSDGYLMRKAITRLMDQISGKIDIETDTKVVISRDDKGELTWKVGAKVIDLTVETDHEPSLCDRIVHVWNMIFYAEYRLEFQSKLQKIVNAYKLFNQNETKADAEAKAIADAKAAADAAEAARVAEEAAKAKADRIAVLTDLIPAIEAGLQKTTSKLAKLDADKTKTEKELEDKKVKFAQLDAARESKNPLYQKLEKLNKSFSNDMVTFPADAKKIKEFASLASGKEILSEDDAEFKYIEIPANRAAILAKLLISVTPSKELNDCKASIARKVERIKTITDQIPQVQTQIADLQADISELKAELDELQPPVPADPNLPVDLVKAQTEFEAGLIGMEQYLHNKIMQPMDDEEKADPSFANFMVSLVKGRELSMKAETDLEWQLSITPGTSKIKYNGLMDGTIDLPASMTLKYTKGGKWELSGDIKLKREDRERAFSLDKTTFKVDADHMTMTVDADMQDSYWDRRYLASKVSKPLAHNEVTTRVFNPAFMG